MVGEKQDQGQADGGGEASGFKVTDKRKFAGDGEKKEEAALPSGEKPETEMPAGDPGAGEAPEDEAPPEVDPSMLEVNFSNFVLSLGTSAVLHFGEIPDPATGKQEKNLPMAKHTIDVLNMLREKTSGNLEAEEEKLLSDLLYQLRMKYVSLT